MMMHFLDQRFPEDISYGAIGGPQYNTDVLTTASGHEKRNVNWISSRIVYNVSHGAKTKEQMDMLIAFFKNCYGKATGFRFKDWSDYECKDQLIGVGDGAKLVFQLNKSYKVGDSFVERKISRPVKYSVEIYTIEHGSLRGSNQKITLNECSIIDYNTGVVTFRDAPLSGQHIYASFQFDIPARFNTDSMNLSIDDYGVHSWKNISIIEIKE